ncbi:MAG: hypothetical protein WKG01_33680 [Kofleriaceae bacterium]
MRTLKILAALTLAFTGACGDDGDNTPKDARPQDAAVEPDASCFENPQTHEEIINACTDAQKIFKASTPPLINPDGTLPSLPP